MKEVFVKTQDNIDIALNHYQDHDGDSVLIIAHGWFMTKDTKQFREISESFLKYIDVITLDFRGHGRSGGGYTFSALEILDLCAVVEYARKYYSNIYLMGFSLGGTIAIQYCSKHEGIKKLITVSAPSDFNRVENCMFSPRAFVPTFKKWFENQKYKIYPRNVRVKNFFLRKIKAIDVVKEVKVPHLLIAGEKDPTVFPWHTKKLFEKSQSAAQMEIFENCYHAEDLFYQARDRFMGVCLDWIR